MSKPRSSAELKWLVPVLLLHASPASAVIVAGASGGGNTTNNTTRAQLESETGLAFPVYSNVIPYSDSTGIYLGYNPSTSDVWVMSARHVSDNNSPLTIDSLSYDHQQRITLTGDIELNRYSRLDNQVPSLPTINLAQSAPGAGEALVMIGIGQNRTEAAATSPLFSDATSTGVGTGYHWATPRIERWGTNNVEAEFPDNFEGGSPTVGVLGNYDGGQAFYADFDEPLPGQWTNSNEAIGTLGDSGGGAFTYNGSEYELSGIFSARTTFTGQQADTSAFGNGTIFTDISSSRAEILSFTGTLVPEPSALGLGLGGLLLTLRRRR